jgi:Gas vesicle synthesis protein GvpL/GvpF
MPECVPGTGRLSYLYGVCAADAPVPRPAPGAETARGAPGPGAAVRLVRHGGLAGVVSSVSADEFGPAGLEACLGDLQRLEALARGHNAVVDAVHARTAVLPMRLATVYLDDDRVADVLRAGADDFGRLLARLGDHDELGVKVYATPQAQEPGAAHGGTAPRAGDGGQPATSPGRAYLRRRQAERRSHRDSYRAAGEVAARLPRAVSGLVRARAAHRPQQGGGARGAGENIANEAYLVARSQHAAFRAAVALLAEGVPGVRVEVTGPWAPYSFSALPDGQEGAVTS